jgi:Fic family protein
MAARDLDALQQRLQALRPLTPEQVVALRGMLKGDEIEAVYASNAIEGNTLTLGETALVIQNGITVSGKPLKDHLEALDHIEALRYVEELVEGPALTQRNLREIHALVMRRSRPEAAGRYRDIPVAIAGTDFRPPPAILVPERMDAVFEAYVSRRETQHPAIVAADLHQGIVDVHPFEDGNGRTARLAMNLHLLQYRFPLTIIHPTDRQAYIEAIATVQQGIEAETFRSFVIENVARSLKRYLHALGEPAAPSA